MKRRNRYRRNPAGYQSLVKWGILAVAIGAAYQRRKRSDGLAAAQPAYTTPTVTPGVQVAPTPPVAMMARWANARAPGYVGIRYGPPVWNGTHWDQPE